MDLFRATLIKAGMIGITLAGIVVARRIAVKLSASQTANCPPLKFRVLNTEWVARLPLPSFAVHTLLKPDFQNKTRFCAISDNRVLY
jgi:hypothetical protein